MIDNIKLIVLVVAWLASLGLLWLYFSNEREAAISQARLESREEQSKVLTELREAGAKRETEFNRKLKEARDALNKSDCSRVLLPDSAAEFVR